VATPRDPDALLRRVVEILDTERLERGWTQAQLGARAGLTQSTLSKYFLLHLRLNLTQLDALCHALSLSVVDVIAEADRTR
jgi:transcriptional regulator with XRE-family HTH domain